MTKTLTEQWREHNLKYKQNYYLLLEDGGEDIQPFMGGFFMSESNEVKEVLAPVPSYDKVKEMSQKIERLEFDNEALEMAHNEGKEINAELVSKTDELVQKIHILNEQNTKQYNELCEEIKKNNILERKLEIATKALKEINKNYRFTVAQDVVYKALKEIKEVK